LPQLKNRIKRWHWGKLVILWAWGGIALAVLWGVFLQLTPRLQPVVTTAVFLAMAVLLVTLSVLTWLWLGGKDAQS
jgi:hypothetical protein